LKETCKSLALCRQHVIDCEPEGTHLDGKVMLHKHVCKACGRIWAEVYAQTGILVELNTAEHVRLIKRDPSDERLAGLDSQKEVTAAAILKMLEHINRLKVSDREMEKGITNNG